MFFVISALTEGTFLNHTAWSPDSDLCPFTIEWTPPLTKIKEASFPAATCEAAIGTAENASSFPYGGWVNDYVYFLAHVDHPISIVLSDSAVHITQVIKPTDNDASVCCFVTPLASVHFMHAIACAFGCFYPFFTIVPENGLNGGNSFGRTGPCVRSLWHPGN